MFHLLGQHNTEIVNNPPSVMRNDINLNEDYARTRINRQGHDLDGLSVDLKRKIQDKFDRLSRSVQSIHGQLLESTDLSRTKYLDVFKKIKSVDILTKNLTSQLSEVTSMSLRLNKFKNVMDSLSRRLDLFVDIVDNADAFSRRNRSRIAGLESIMATLRGRHGTDISLLGSALLGNIELYSVDADAEDVSAAALNEAATGTYKKTITILTAADAPLPGGGSEKIPHTWANYEPVITGDVAGVTDADILAPTFVDGLFPANTPASYGGTQVLDIVFCTDAGSTMTWQSGDQMDVVVQVNASDSISGNTVTAFTKVYNIIA